MSKRGHPWTVHEQQCMDANGHLCTFMGTSWTTVGAHRRPRTSERPCTLLMDIRESIYRSSLDIHRQPWTSMDSCGHPWTVRGHQPWTPWPSAVYASFQRCYSWTSVPVFRYEQIDRCEREAERSHMAKLAQRSFQKKGPRSAEASRSMHHNPQRWVGSWTKQRRR